MLPVNKAEVGSTALPFWQEVHSEMARLEKIKVTNRTWEQSDAIYLIDNGRRLPGGAPNPNRKGAITIIGTYKMAAKLIVEGMHDLANEQEVIQYLKEQDQIRADMARQKASKDGVIRFQAPSFEGGAK